MIMFVIITLYPVLNTLAISLNDGTDALRWRDLPAAEKIYMEKLYYRAAERQPDYGCLHHGCKNRPSEQHLHCLPTRFWHLLSAENVSCLKNSYPCSG